MTKHIVTVPEFGDSRFKRWAKVLTRVDTDQANGYAFVGDFAYPGRKVELAAGAYILSYGETGSRKNNSPDVLLSRVGALGELETAYERMDLNRSWALDVRDDIAAIVNAPATDADDNPLAAFDDEAILAEARRRGLIQ